MFFPPQVEQSENGSFVASVLHKKNVHHDDDVGALYYVVVVILIYGCSILMMIASYIRKNNVDRKLNRYLKEMANVRKRERQMQLISAAAKAAAHPGVAGRMSTQYSDASEMDTDMEERARAMMARNMMAASPMRSQQSKIFLDLPSNAYNTDSDNETSTEEPVFYTPVKPKSILKNSQNKSVKLLVPGTSEPQAPRAPDVVSIRLQRSRSTSLVSSDPSPQDPQKESVASASEVPKPVQTMVVTEKDPQAELVVSFV